MKNYKKIIAVVAAGLACTAITSQASWTPLNPGQFNIGIAAGGEFVPSVVPSDLLATLTSAYNFGGVDVGTLTTQVYKNAAGNPLGGLEFVYTILVSVGDVTGLTVNGFSGPVTVNNVVGGAPLASQGTYNNTGGVNFNFGLANAVTTVKVVVGVSQTSWAGATGNIQDTVAGNAPTLGPVPEPSTVVAGALMLLPFGIGAIRSLRKDRTA